MKTSIVGKSKAKGAVSKSPVKKPRRASSPGITQPSFEVESATLDKKLPALLKSGAEGKWVVVYGKELAGPFDDLDSALGHGYRTYGDVAFMVEQLFAEPPVEILPSCLRTA